MEAVGSVAEVACFGLPGLLCACVCSVPSTEGILVYVCVCVCVNGGSVREPKHDTDLVVPGCPSTQQVLYCLELWVSGISFVAGLLEAIRTINGDVGG